MGFPGGIQWDGKYMAIEDDMKDTIYRVNFSGSTGTVAGTVHLGVRSHLVVQFWLQGNTIIVPFGGSPRTVKKIGLWNYPAGGKPTAQFDGVGATELVGAAISVVPRNPKARGSTEFRGTGWHRNRRHARHRRGNYANARRTRRVRGGRL